MCISTLQTHCKAEDACINGTYQSIKVAKNKVTFMRDERLVNAIETTAYDDGRFDKFNIKCYVY